MFIGVGNNDWLIKTLAKKRRILIVSNIKQANIIWTQKPIQN